MKRFFNSIRLINKVSAIAYFCLLAVVSNVAFSQEFLPPEQAFKVSGRLSEAGIEIQIEPVSGYYVYKESLHFYVGQNTSELPLNQINLPVPKRKFDENFQKIVETYNHPINFVLPLKMVGEQIPIDIQIGLQGCAEKGICYPPMTRVLHLTEYGQSVLSVSLEDSLANKDSNTKSGLSSWWEARQDLSALSRLLETASLPTLLIAFFILGIGLAFTPCMLPMLPILSSIVFGTTNHHLLTRKRTVFLALLYIAGMALAFTLAGVATASFGAGIQVFLQNPWVIVAFGILMLGLAGSLLGFYEIHLPQFWHAHIDRLIGRQKGGSAVGAFALGALSSLVASPCVTAPMAGVLTFIAQSGQVKLGGLILFTMAWGMGVPLLLFAFGASRLVPRAGGWMVRVQRVFGMLMVLLAIWVMLPGIKALTANTETQAKQIGSLTFTIVRTPEELNQKIAIAKIANKQILLSFYADWCVSCKELESGTLSDSRVVQKLQNFELIEIDLTKVTSEQKSLLKQFELFGPPALLVLTPDGKEKRQQRVVGYISADKYLQYLSAN